MRLGPWELGLIVVIALLVFGPKKLPALGKSMAEFLKNFKTGLKDVQKETDEVKKNLNS